MTRSGIASSAALHVGVLILVVVGLPSLFHHPPAEEQPIAVELVMIAPETKATHPNPYKPRPDAKPEPPVAAPAPKPEPKPEPPPPVPEPPAAAAAPTPPPPPPEPPRPEAKAPPAPPPPPPKPVEAQAPPLPPPVPRPPEPKPKPEIRQAHHVPRPAPPSKADPAAFDNLLKTLEHQRPTVDKPPRKVEQRRQEQAFDALLQNLTPEQTAEAEDVPPRPHKMAATAPPSSQPKAPLGSQLTASDIDLVRERLRPCFNPPFGAKEKPDLVADIRVVMSRDGTVQQARVADTGQYNSDEIYRAVADAGIRALRNERCSPLPLPADRFDLWQTFTFGFSTKDMQ